MSTPWACCDGMRAAFKELQRAIDEIEIELWQFRDERCRQRLVEALSEETSSERRETGNR